MSSAYWRALRFSMHYWLLSPRLCAVLIAARFASTLVDVLGPLAAGRLVDAVASSERDVTRALAALALFIGIIIAFQVLRNVVAFLINHISARAMVALVRDAFARVQRFSADWHANAFAGATVRKITRGMWAFDSMTDTLIFNLAPAAIMILGVTALFFWRWPLLGVVALCGIAVFLVVSIALSLTWIGPAARAAQYMDSALSARLADSISGNQVVKSFAAEAREDDAFARVVDEWKLRAVTNWNRGAVVGVAQTGVLILMQAALLTTGLFLWSQDRMSTGDVASLLTMQALINGYLRDIGQQVRNVQKSVNEMEDVIGFADAPSEIADAPSAKKLEVKRGEIVFEGVSFGYPGAGVPLYDDFSLTIRPGERIGLVGASGAGKSTFVKLLQRQFDLDAGRILIDGQDIAKVTQASLREAIGIVAQEPILFHRPLDENIAFGRPQASPAEIREASRLAHADIFIHRLLHGYATLVGERGVKLSGGERQRVAIARAILADTPILVLDEATSSLDSVSELYIREAIERLSSGRTTIVVAHRLSTVQALDRILVFDHGRIVEDGTHASLVRRPNGFYQRLFETQVAGGMPEWQAQQAG